MTYSCCKSACYCSKECQRADWKAHKKFCTPGKSPGISMMSNVFSYVCKNYDQVMERVVKVAQVQNVKMNDLTLELDFNTQDGCATALRDPPEFTVGITRHYFEGSRLVELDWFQKGTKDYKDFMVRIRAAFQDLPSDYLFTIVRSPEGHVIGSPVQIMTADNRRSAFSEYAIDVFSRKVNGDKSAWRSFCGLDSAK